MCYDWLMLRVGLPSLLALMSALACGGIVESEGAAAGGFANASSSSQGGSPATGGSGWIIHMEVWRVWRASGQLAELAKGRMNQPRECSERDEPLASGQSSAQFERIRAISAAIRNARSQTPGSVSVSSHMSQATFWSQPTCWS
jgi:hypothetical protein